MGTVSKCVGGYAGVFDLSGNVFELEDSCNSLDAGATAKGVSRGGSYASAAKLGDVRHGVRRRPDLHRERYGVSVL